MYIKSVLCLSDLYLSDLYLSEWNSKFNGTDDPTIELY